MLVRAKFGKSGLAAMALSVAVGALVSPAFTLGTCVRTRISAAVAGAAAVAWGMFRWHAQTWELYTQPLSTAFGAMNARIEGVVTAAAVTEAALLTASCFLAGAICRKVYESSRESRSTLAMGAAAAVLITVAQAGLTHTRLEEAIARGIEGGRINTVAEARRITQAVASEVAPDDREKLLLGYAERLAFFRNLGMNKAPPDYRQYIMGMSEACLGAEKEITICDNAILAEVRRTGKIPEVAITRGERRPG
jgi:hypothetical protein